MAPLSARETSTQTLHLRKLGKCPRRKRFQACSFYLRVEDIHHIAIEYQEFGDARHEASIAAAHEAVPGLVDQLLAQVPHSGERLARNAFPSQPWKTTRPYSSGVLHGCNPIVLSLNRIGRSSLIVVTSTRSGPRPPRNGAGLIASIEQKHRTERNCAGKGETR